MNLRRKKPSDSLYMLLDTMCNAFGGIILLAVLVVLLTNQEKSQQAQTAGSQGALHHRVVVAQTELDQSLQLKSSLQAKADDPRGKQQMDLLVARKDLQEALQNTRDTIAAFRDAGVLPDMVQVGNEITNGMLWPDGKLPANWEQFAELVYAGINGVDAGRGNGPRPKIMIHIDRGADAKGTKWFLDKLNSYEIPYDIIGQSYYPWWHGSLNDLRKNLQFMATEYKKDIIVVETAYNWKPGNYTNKPAPFSESAEGQREFLDELNRVVMETPDGRGKGVFWWEPAVQGPLTIRGLFDDQNRALPAMTVFDRFTRK